MTVNFRGYLFDDAGDPVSGASVQLLETGTTTQEGSTATTDSNGLWYFNEADQDRYDVKITSGASIRYRRWDDEISIKEIDVRNNSAAGTPAATFTNLTNSASNQVAVFSGANSTRADGDEIYLSFKMADSAGNIDEFARMTVDATDVTTTQEDGQIRFSVLVDGTLTDVFTINSSESAGTSMTLDVSGDLTLDADGGDIFFKDGGTTFGSATNTGGNLILKSGTTTAATFSGANVTFAGTVTTGTDGSGTDVIFYSGTSGDNLTWDASEEVLQITGTDGATALDVLDGDVRVVDKLYLYDRGGEYLSSDGSTLTITGATTVSGGLTSTAASNSFGATSFGDADITNVGDIALDSISADGTDINIAVDDNSATALTIKQGSDAYLIVDTANSSESVSIGTGVSGTAITLGHSTSEVTVADNLTVTGDLTVSGTTTTLDTTTLTVNDPLVKYGQTYTGSGVDQGFIVTRGDGSSSNTQNMAFIWDESADQFAAIKAATEDGTTVGNVTVTDYVDLHAGSLVAADNFTVGTTVITDDSLVMTPTTDDTVTIAAATNGALNITTVDTAAAAANIQITADGTAELAGTTVTLDSSGDIELEATDINIGTNIGLTFADDGQKIESDGTDFTIASGAKLNLTPTSDVHVANGTGLVVGHTAQVTVSAAAEAQILGTAEADSTLIVGRWSADTDPPAINFVKSRNGTIGSSTIDVDGDSLGTIAFYVDDGADYASYAAKIQGALDGTIAENRTPGSLTFSTTADSADSTAPTTRMTIDSAGVVTTTGVLTPTGGMLVNSKVQIDQTELVISSGVATVTRGYHSLDGEGNAADDLDTINGGVDGMLLVLRSNNAARDITLTESGNLKLSSSSMVLSDPKDTIMLIYQAGGSYWTEISRSDNQ